jgi:hypothetical protein
MCGKHWPPRNRQRRAAAKAKEQALFDPAQPFDDNRGTAELVNARLISSLFASLRDGVFSRRNGIRKDHISGLFGNHDHRGVRVTRGQGWKN